MASEYEILTLVRMVISSASFVGNLLTLVILLRITGYSSHRSLVKHLTFADMLVGIFGITLGTLDVTLPTLRLQPCSFIVVIFLRWVVTASMLLVVLMAVEHFMAIFRPWSYKASFTEKNMKIAVVLIWIVSVLLQFSRLPQALFIYHQLVKTPEIAVTLYSLNTTRNRSDPLLCQIYNSPTMHQMDYYVLFTVTCACLIIVICVYSYIAVNARAQLRRPGRHSNHALSEHSRRHRKLMKTTFFIVLTFVLCWAPVCCILFMRSVINKSNSGLERKIEMAKHYAFALPYINSLCDPIIYSMRMREVRQGYRDILEFFKLIRL